MISPEVILTIGISNSGKSTWARKFIDENPNFTEINRDDMRIAFFCDGDRSKYLSYKYSSTREQMITDVAEVRAKSALSTGVGVVISDTNLNGKTRAFWKAFAKEHDVPYREVVFDVTLHTCLARNRKRDITLPQRVIIQQYASYRKFKGLDGYTPNPELPDAIICDLDGTLLLHNDRKPFEYEKCDTDTPDPTVLQMVKDEQARGTKIIIFTGREDTGSCRRKTMAVLEGCIGTPDVYDMRAEGDHRPDVIAKEDMFNKIKDQYNIKYALDDRDQVVNLWRCLGLKCLQVAQGDF